MEATRPPWRVFRPSIVSISPRGIHRLYSQGIGGHRFGPHGPTAASDLSGLVGSSERPEKEAEFLARRAEFAP